MGDGRVKEALLRLAGHESGPGFPPVQQAGPAVQSELASQLFAPGAMALVAMFRQDRTDVLLEEFHLGQVSGSRL